MAFYKYFWDLASSTTLADHTVGSFDNNTTTGGGDFKWVSNANNTLVSNIPGILIKPTSTTNGYWIRVMSGPISVDWFGPQNTTSAPYTFAQLGVSQATLNSRYGVNFVNLNDTYDTAAVKYALYYMGVQAIENSVQFEPKNYWLTRSIDIPSVNSGATGLPGVGGQGKFIIDGNGCTITTYGTGAPFDVFRRIPANQTEADTWVNYSVVFKNFSANSWGSSWVSSGYSFLFLGASANAVIDNINLVNYDIGIRLEYCPNATLSNIYTSGVKTRSVYVKSGSWLGATLTNSNSNNAAVYQMQVEDTDSQTAALSFAGVNNAYVSQFWLKGPGTPTYGIWWDSLNNTEAYNVRIMDTYVSVATAAAGSAIYIKMQNGGLALVDGLYNSVVHNTVAAEMYSGTGNLYFSNSVVWPAGSTLSNVGTIKWDIKTVNLGPGITTAANVVDPLNNLWVTAGPPVIPSVSNIIYQIPGGPAPAPNVTLQSVLDYDRTLVNGDIYMGTDSGLNYGAGSAIGIGTDACKNGLGSSNIGIGDGAGEGNQSDQAIMIGVGAGFGQVGGNLGVAIGTGAAVGNTGADVIAIGTGAASGNTSSNVIALGENAGVSNTLAGSAVILSNSALRSYVNHAAALVDITALNGATSGTYLYHNQATDSIGAVRIP